MESVNMDALVSEDNARDKKRIDDWNNVCDEAMGVDTRRRAHCMMATSDNGHYDCQEDDTGNEEEENDDLHEDHDHNEDVVQPTKRRKKWSVSSSSGDASTPQAASLSSSSLSLSSSFTNVSGSGGLVKAARDHHDFPKMRTKLKEVIFQLDHLRKGLSLALMDKEFNMASVQNRFTRLYRKCYEYSIDCPHWSELILQRYIKTFTKCLAYHNCSAWKTTARAASTANAAATEEVDPIQVLKGATERWYQLHKNTRHFGRFLPTLTAAQQQPEGWPNMDDMVRVAFREHILCGREIELVFGIMLVRDDPRNQHLHAQYEDFMERSQQLVPSMKDALQEYEAAKKEKGHSGQMYLAKIMKAVLELDQIRVQVNESLVSSEFHFAAVKAGFTRLQRQCHETCSLCPGWSILLYQRCQSLFSKCLAYHNFQHQPLSDHHGVDAATGGGHMTLLRDVANRWIMLEQNADTLFGETSSSQSRQGWPTLQEMIHRTARDHVLGDLEAELVDAMLWVVEDPPRRQYEDFEDFIGHCQTLIPSLGKVLRYTTSDAMNNTFPDEETRPLSAPQQKIPSFPRDAVDDVGEGRAGDASKGGAPPMLNCVEKVSSNQLARQNALQSESFIRGDQIPSDGSFFVFTTKATWDLPSNRGLEEYMAKICDDALRNDKTKKPPRVGALTKAFFKKCEEDRKTLLCLMRDKDGKRPHTSMDDWRDRSYVAVKIHEAHDVIKNPMKKILQSLVNGGKQKGVRVGLVSERAKTKTAPIAQSQAQEGLISHGQSENLVYTSHEQESDLETSTELEVASPEGQVNAPANPKNGSDPGNKNSDEHQGNVQLDPEALPSCSTYLTPDEDFDIDSVLGEAGLQVDIETGLMSQSNMTCGAPYDADFAALMNEDVEPVKPGRHDGSMELGFPTEASNHSCAIQDVKVVGPSVAEAGISLKLPNSTTSANEPPPESFQHSTYTLSPIDEDPGAANECDQSQRETMSPPSRELAVLPGSTDPTIAPNRCVYETTETHDSVGYDAESTTQHFFCSAAPPSDCNLRGEDSSLAHSSTADTSSSPEFSWCRPAAPGAYRVQQAGSSSFSDDASVNTYQTLGSVASHVMLESSGTVSIRNLQQRVEELEQLRARWELGESIVVGGEPIQAELVSDDGAFVGATYAKNDSTQVESSGTNNRFWISFCRCICLRGLFGWSSWFQR